jgi:hypothetical protein
MLVALIVPPPFTIIEGKGDKCTKGRVAQRTYFETLSYVDSMSVPLIKGDFDLYVAAGRRCVHHRGDPFQVQSHTGPFRAAGQHHEGQFSSGQVLLVADPSIRREQEIKRGLLGSLQQPTIGEPIPSSALSGSDRMTGKRPSQAPLGRSVVKENEH